MMLLPTRSPRLGCVPARARSASIVMPMEASLMTVVSDSRPLFELPGRPGTSIPRRHEYRVYKQLVLRDWDVTDLRIETLAEPRQLHVLRLAGARMSGPDWLATRITDLARWAIDAKTSSKRPKAPGCNWYSVSLDSLLNMESYARRHNVPAIFVLGDMYAITPDEVRGADPKAERGERYGTDGKRYFLIPSGAGRPFEQVFGRIGELDAEVAA